MKKENKSSSTKNKKASSTRKKSVSDDVYAAIALALFEANRAHDEESGKVTIRRIDRRFSPWALKTLTLRELPKR